MSNTNQLKEEDRNAKRGKMLKISQRCQIIIHKRDYKEEMFYEVRRKLNE